MMIKHINRPSNYCFLKTCREGTARQVKLLLDEGVDVNVIDEDDRRTSLIEACLGGSVEIVDLLLKNGVHINAVDNYGNTALVYACAGGFIKIVKLLLQYDADIKRYGYKALEEACDNNHIEIVIFLIDQGISVRGASIYLMNACNKGFTEIVQLLLNNAADFNF